MVQAYMYVYIRPDSALGSHEMNIDRMIMNQLYPKIAALSALKNPARQSRALRLGQLHKGIVFVTSVICASHGILEESRTQQQHPQDHPRH